MRNFKETVKLNVRSFAYCKRDALDAPDGVGLVAGVGGPGPGFMQPHDVDALLSSTYLLTFDY